MIGFWALKSSAWELLCFPSCFHPFLLSDKSPHSPHLSHSSFSLWTFIIQNLNIWLYKEALVPPYLQWKPHRPSDLPTMRSNFMPTALALQPNRCLLMAHSRTRRTERRRCDRCHSATGPPLRQRRPMGTSRSQRPHKIPGHSSPILHLESVAPTILLTVSTRDEGNPPNRRSSWVSLLSILYFLIQCCIIDLNFEAFPKLSMLRAVPHLQEHNIYFFIYLNYIRALDRFRLRCDHTRTSFLCRVCIYWRMLTSSLYRSPMLDRTPWSYPCVVIIALISATFSSWPLPFQIIAYRHSITHSSSHKVSSSERCHRQRYSTPYMCEFWQCLASSWHVYANLSSARHNLHLLIFYSHQRRPASHLTTFKPSENH